MIPFSPGVANACFDLLELASRQRLSFSDIRDAFSQIGVVSTHFAIETSQGLGWLRASDEGIAVLTPSGSRLLAIAASELRLRQAILDYIDQEEPFWVQDASFGRKRLLAFAGTQVAQLFLEAGLVDGTSPEVVAFWDALAARARGQKNDRLLAIGREGERLTIAYEQERTGKRPKWISVDNNEDGYDVLSVVDRSDARQMSIEVKATTVGSYGSFFLTRNEWERALEAPIHAFHLWDLSAKAPKLAVVTPADVKPHISIDRGAGEWVNIHIPVEAFKARFGSARESLGPVAL